MLSKYDSLYISYHIIFSMHLHEIGTFAICGITISFGVVVQTALNYAYDDLRSRSCDQQRAITDQDPRKLHF